MDHIPANQQWDSVAAFLDGYALQLIDDVNVDHIQNGTDTTGLQVVPHLRGHAFVAAIDLIHLPHFLVERRCGKQ